MGWLFGNLVLAFHTIDEMIGVIAWKLQNLFQCNVNPNPQNNQSNKTIRSIARSKNNHELWPISSELIE